MLFYNLYIIKRFLNNTEVCFFDIIKLKHTYQRKNDTFKQSVLQYFKLYLQLSESAYIRFNHKPVISSLYKKNLKAVSDFQALMYLVHILNAAIQKNARILFLCTQTFIKEQDALNTLGLKCTSLYSEKLYNNTVDLVLVCGITKKNMSLVTKLEYSGFIVEVGSLDTPIEASLRIPVINVGRSLEYFFIEAFYFIIKTQLAEYYNKVAAGNLL